MFENTNNLVIMNTKKTLFIKRGKRERNSNARYHLQIISAKVYGEICLGNRDEVKQIEIEIMEIMQ